MSLKAYINNRIQLLEEMIQEEKYQYIKFELLTRLRELRKLEEQLPSITEL